MYVQGNYIMCVAPWKYIFKIKIKQIWIWGLHRSNMVLYFSHINFLYRSFASNNNWISCSRSNFWVRTTRKAISLFIKNPVLKHQRTIKAVKICGYKILQRKETHWGNVGSWGNFSSLIYKGHGLRNKEAKHT